MRLWATLQLEWRHASSHRTAHDNGLGQDIRRTVWVRILTNITDDLAGLKTHLATRLADTHKLCARLDVVARKYRREKFNGLVCAKEALIAIEPNQELRREVAKQCEHARTIDQLSGVVRIVSRHTEAYGNFETNHGDGA